MAKTKAPNGEDDGGLVISDKTVRVEPHHRFVSSSDLDDAIATIPVFDLTHLHPKLPYYKVEVSPGSIRVSQHASKLREPRVGKTVRRNNVVSWSNKSRSKMVLRLATLDYSPFDIPNSLMAFITLTYPSDWRGVVPTAAKAKNHLHRLRKRFERRFNRPFYAVWKMEFQRRGAPHFHLLAPVPSGVDFNGWLSHTWTDIVKPSSPEERVNHLAAGTGVDRAKGFTATDPQRISYYFSKHSSANKGVKEYQNTPPVEWIVGGTVGRFWGYWGLHPSTRSVPISDADAVVISRTLRRWQKANSKVVKVRVWRTNTKTGKRYQRTVHRRYKVKSAGIRAFRLVPNGAAFLEHLAQSLHDSSP